MQTSPSHFMIYVKDMEKSLDFYEKKIGVKILYKTDEWSELSFNNNLILALRKVNIDGDINSSGIGFHVENCEEATKYYESLGVEIQTRCEERNGNILTQFKDPDGNVIWLAQKIN